MRLLCLLLLGLDAAATPCVRWIDEKGDIHVEELRAVIEETPSELQVRLADGAARTIPMARVLDLVRESDEREEERALLDARRDVAFGVRLDAARVTLDRIAAAGSAPWVREYAVAARALLAERAREEDAEARLRRFLDDHPRSRFQSDGLAALARVRARAERDLGKVNGVLHEAHVRIAEIGGPIALRCRVLRDGAERYLEVEPILLREFLKARQDALHAEMGGGEDYGAYLLVEAEYKWASLLCEQKSAAADEAAGRAPHGALNQVRKIAARAGLDLPEVRSDIERELGRLLLACGDKEGARGALERARDLAPDPRRREAAADALRRLGTG